MIWMNVNQTVKKEAEISNEFSVMCEIYFVNCRTKPVQLAGQNFNMRV